MDAFGIGETFDAVVRLFSSIGYTGDLSGAIGSMAGHPSPGGILIVGPWLRPDHWVAGHVQVLNQEADGIHLVRMYLVRSSSGIEHLFESHRLTLFSAFFASNLTFEFDQNGPAGRGALIGRAP